MPASRADPSGYRQNGVTLKLDFLGRNNFGWKTLLLSLLLVGGELAHPTSSTPITFDSIKFWTGTGTNKAAMVIQWNDAGTPTSLLWGYRWDGVATGIDMVQAIAGNSFLAPKNETESSITLNGSDHRLTTSWVYYQDYGYAIESIIMVTGSETRTQSDWASGYWEYNLFGGQFSYDEYDANWEFTGTQEYNQVGSSLYSNVEWLSSPIGASNRSLVDGSWDAWSFAPGFNPVAVEKPLPVSVPPPICKSISKISSSELEIVFKITPDILYQFEFNDELLPSGWTSSGQPFTDTVQETLLRVTINPNNPKKFFRLRQLP
jgi:hypothetical protein